MRFVRDQKLNRSACRASRKTLFHNADGNPEGSFYIEFGRIEQAGIFSHAKRGCRPPRIPRIAAMNIGQNILETDRVARTRQFQPAAAGAGEVGAEF